MDENSKKREMLRCCANRIVLLTLAIFLGTITRGQSLTDESPMKLQHKAERYFDEGDYYNAYRYFNELVSRDSVNRSYQYHLGVCMLQLRSHRYESLPHLYNAGPDVSPEWYYYTAKALHLHNHFEEAILLYRKYKVLKADKYFPDAQVESCINESITAMQYELAPNGICVQKMEGNINTPFPEYAPLVSADGTQLFFTSRRPQGEVSPIDARGEYFEDIYYSTYSDHSWTDPVRLPEPVNGYGHDACVGLTADGTKLFFYRANEQLKTGMLYETTREKDGWSEPVQLDEDINSPEYVETSACISADGNVIYFSSNRPGGLGGIDIYRLVRLPNGKWSKALNLGAGVNTPGDEDSPFIHPDGNMLYFSSNGRKGMGGYDVYYAEIDTNGNWQPAVNLGYPLNTTDDDVHFVITEDRKTAYYSSCRPGGSGEADIYKILLNGEESQMMVQEGFVFDGTDSTLAVHAKLTLIDLNENKLTGVYASNRTTGKFILILNPAHTYQLIVESTDHHAFVEQWTYVPGTIHKLYLSQKKQ